MPPFLKVGVSSGNRTFCTQNVRLPELTPTFYLVLCGYPGAGQGLLDEVAQVVV